MTIKGRLLSHGKRADRIYILTLDQILAADIYERINSDPRGKDYDLVRPRNKEIVATRQEIERMAPHTVSSKLLIMDVRSYTLPRLRKAFNMIINYNRKDLNRLCYAILIGDGPTDLFYAGISLDVFVINLQTHRRDFEPVVFFYDPLIHYTSSDRKKGSDLPDCVPKRLKKGFEERKINAGNITEVRRYFRAASVPPEEREETKRERENELKQFYRERIMEEFPHHRNKVENWLRKEGYSMEGEKLRLHLYPLFFEDYVFELMKKAPA